MAQVSREEEVSLRSDSKARAGYPRLSGEASGASPAGCLFGERSRTQLHAWSVAGFREHHCYPHTWESSVQVGLAERTTGPWMAFPTAWLEIPSLGAVHRVVCGRVSWPRSWHWVTTHVFCRHPFTLLLPTKQHLSSVQGSLQGLAEPLS